MKEVAIYVAINSNVSIVSSSFQKNKADVGAALFVKNSCITIDNTTFIENQVGERPPQNYLNIAGVLYQEGGNILITNCYFENNSASIGGSMFAVWGALMVYGSTFCSNEAMYGGVFFITYADMISAQCQFDHNKAKYGGVIRSFSSNVTIEGSLFHINSATFAGVVLSYNSSFIINGSEFNDNNAMIAGAVMVAAVSTTKYYGSILITNNSAAKFGTSFMSECNEQFLGNITVSNNLGSLVVIYSNITFSGNVVFTNNSQQNSTVNLLDGGAVSLFQSNAIFNGICRFEHNQGESGGALHSTDSKLYVNGDVTLIYNRATENGGGIYLSYSELNCQHKSLLHLLGNTATHRGCLLYTSPSPRDATLSRMPSSA